MRTLALLPLLLVVACSGPDTVSAPPASPAGSPAAATSLVVEVVTTPGAAPIRWTLTCDPPGGDHPAPEAACRVLAAAPAPFAPVPADALCTQQYGGPQTATVRGTYRGEPVDLALSRVDGCRISQWDALGALLLP